MWHNCESSNSFLFRFTAVSKITFDKVNIYSKSCKKFYKCPSFSWTFLIIAYLEVHGMPVLWIGKYSICCKIFKVCLTSLRRALCIKGLNIRLVVFWNVTVKDLTNMQSERWYEMIYAISYHLIPWGSITFNKVARFSLQCY